MFTHYFFACYFNNSRYHHLYFSQVTLWMLHDGWESVIPAWPPAWVLTAGVWSSSSQSWFTSDSLMTALGPSCHLSYFINQSMQKGSSRHAGISNLEKYSKNVMIEPQERHCSSPFSDTWEMRQLPQFCPIIRHVTTAEETFLGFPHRQTHSCNKCMFLNSWQSWDIASIDRHCFHYLTK